jgi:Cu2+-exporting ATPase
MVSDAAATKAPIAKLADRVSGVFVPTVMTIAAVTLVAWLLAERSMGFALARAISVLVISCPCALGLATPVAVMVGNGMGAKNGILFKTAAALESCGKADLVIMDKTGTLTQGLPTVTEILPHEAVTVNDLLEAAYALEQNSEHPLSRAIVAEAERRSLPSPAPVTDFHALAGSGVEAKRLGSTLLGGNKALMEAAAVPIPPTVQKRADALANQGMTPLFFAENGNLLGMIAVADVLKEDSPRAVEELHAMGIETVMLTGDNEQTARAIAAKAGIDRVIAGVRPEGKANAVEQLKQNGRVIMVGDGINDAVALTSAHVGIAIGAGSDVAIEAADVVLVNNRLTDVSAAIRLSRATLRNIRENLFWAFFYNVVGIPLAAGVWIPLLGWELNPMFGAAAMSLSSFCVVTNALRLNLFPLRDPRKFRSAKKSVPHTETDPIPSQRKESAMKKTMKIEGMMCPRCVAHVKEALESVKGVREVEVSLEEKTATVKGAVKSIDLLTAAVIKAGYQIAE